MFDIPLAHATGELDGVEKLVLATVRRATTAAFASVVAITACSAAGQEPAGVNETRQAATSPVDESSSPGEERHALYPGSGSLMVDSPEECEPGKYWSQWKYSGLMDFESIMACKR
jgi:hypothetical protein